MTDSIDHASVPRPDSPRLRPDQLLEHVDWVRRLASRLASDKHGVDDLVQSTFLTALLHPPRVGGGSIRGWLARVLTNEARSDHRGLSRQRAREEAVARNRGLVGEDPEEIERRFALHRSLVTAVDALDEPQRTAIVLRYFEELPPRLIAERLGEPLRAIETRLRRARAKLRKSLDSEYGTRGSWAVLALPAASFTPVTPTLGGTAGAALIMKKLVSFAVVLLALLVGGQFILPDAEREVPPADADLGSADVPAPGDDTQLAGAPSQVTVRTEITPPAETHAAGDGHSPITVPENVRERASLLRVVDSQGVPIPDVRGAWVGQNLDIIALDFDESGCAERPTDAPGHALVRADGHLGRAVVLAQAIEGEADLEIPLRPWYVLRGVVRIDGVPPGEPILFHRLVSPEQCGCEPDFMRIWDRLVTLGVPPYSLAVPVEPDGSFALTIEWEFDLVPLRSRSDVRVRSVNGAPPRFGDRWAAADAGTTSIEIHLARLPAVVGRLMWDDGESASGEHLSFISRTGTEERPSRQEETADSNGAFAFAVEGTSATLQTLGRRLSDDLPLEIDLEGAVFPLDLGVLELRRPPLLQIEVVGRRGGVERPVVALVSTGIASGWTDETGRVVLEFDPARSVEVFAEGYKSYRTDPTSDVSPLRVVLEPGASLTVIVDGELTDARCSGRLRVRLAFNRSPFDSAIPAGHRGARSFSPALYQGFLRGHDVSWSVDMGDAAASGAVSIGSPGPDPLVVPGLVSGAELRVELIDPLGAVLSSQRVVADPAGTTVILGADQIDVTTLTLDPRWADGSPIKQGRVRVRGRGVGAKAFYFHLPTDGLVLGPIAPCVVDITTEVPGAKNVEIRDVHVGANELPIVISLERER